MYQAPLQKLEQIRTSRKRVKSILSDIGLDQCQELLQELKDFDAGDSFFETTEWEDFTDCYAGHRRKKWCYRTQTLCCALCWFSTRSWYTYRSHVQRCHEEEEDLASLSPCPRCSFIGRPDLLNNHLRLFHGVSTGSAKPPAPAPAPPSLPAQQGALHVNAPLTIDKFSCSRCSFHDSLLYVMRKHVLVRHCGPLLKRYYGQRSVTPPGSTGTQASLKFYCKVCEMPADTPEHLLYHLLSSDKHRELHAQIRPIIVEHAGFNHKALRNAPAQGPAPLPHLAPRTVQQVVSLVSKSSGPLSNGKPAPSPGAVLLAAPPHTTALVCSTTGHSVLLSSPSASTSQTGRLPGLASAARSISLLLPSGSQGKQMPLAVTVPAPPQPRQVLLPPGMAFNVQGKVGGGQPLMLAQPGPRGAMLPSQSVRLVPTGNKVNGMPTYTLATVQLAVPVQTGVGTAISKPPILITVPQSASQSQPVTVQRNGTPNNPSAGSLVRAGQARQLVVQSQYLVRTATGMVCCTRCKILLSDKGIFQHLLHGLQCLFCPLMFYSLKQLLEHSEAEHSLADGTNQQQVRKDYNLNTTSAGRLVLPHFDISTTVPRDLLGCKELHVALLTEGKALLYIRMTEEPAKTASPSLPQTGCPFCPEKPRSSAAYELHLRTQHHILPTIHAILKTPAFKCVYCLGVYTDKSSSRTISIHVQRCRCAPRAAKEAERLLNPDPNAPSLNGESLPPAGPTASDPSKTRTSVAARPEMMSSWGKGKAVRSGPVLSLMLDPTGLKQRSLEERKSFLGRYFNKKPYLTRTESDCLAEQLCLSRAEVLSVFGSKRSHCLRTIRRRRATVLLGFDTHQLSKVRHNLIIPPSEPAKLPPEPTPQSFTVLEPDPCPPDLVPTETGRSSPGVEKRDTLDQSQAVPEPDPQHTETVIS